MSGKNGEARFLRFKHFGSSQIKDASGWKRETNQRRLINLQPTNQSARPAA